MKLERIYWGVILLFIGGVLLLQNLDVIPFYWRNVWAFWPILLITAGIKMVFNRQGKQTGTAIALAIMVVTLGFIFHRGQQKINSNSFFSDFGIVMDDDFDTDWDNDTKNNLSFSEPYDPADSAKKIILNLSGGGGSFSLKDNTDSLIEANVSRKKGNFSLTKVSSDSVTTLSFAMNNTKNSQRNNWHLNSGGAKVNFFLNPQPIWNLNVKVGAAELDFDLSQFKIQSLNFDGGASAIEVKLGDLFPNTAVNIKTGVANVEFKVPQSSGCRIKIKTGLSSTNFEGFVKKENGIYETANYASAPNKIILHIDGGLSNFEVERYDKE